MMIKKKNMSYMKPSIQTRIQANSGLLKYVQMKLSKMPRMNMIDHRLEQ